jgi:hypothetical protein
LCEVPSDKAAEFSKSLKDILHTKVGHVNDSARLTISASTERLIDAELSALKRAWQSPLAW